MKPSVILRKKKISRNKAVLVKTALASFFTVKEQSVRGKWDKFDA